MPLVPVATVVLLKRRALREGILGGSFAWRLVAVAVFGLPLLRRVTGRHPETVLIEELRPGERMVITPIKPLNRRQRRAARRASRS